MRFSDTFTTLVRQVLESGSTPALMGEPGIGKSSFIEGLAEQMGTKAFILPMNQLADKADFTGARLVPYTRADGSESYKQVFYPHQVIQDAIDYATDHPGEYPILALDEINRTTSDVTSAGLTAITLRRIGSIDIPDNVRIIVAGNDRGNVTTLDQASLSRFVIFRVEPDAATLMSVLSDLHPWIKEVLTQNPQFVFQRAATGSYLTDGTDDDDDDDDKSQTTSVEEIWDRAEKMSQLTTPRTIDNLSRWLNDVPQDELAQHLMTETLVDGRATTVLNEIVEAYVGETPFATELIAVIAKEVASSSGNGSSTRRISVPRPACYAQLKQATTITDLDFTIAGLSDVERGSALMYALKESEDNARLVEQLSAAITSLEPEHTKVLIDLTTTQQADRMNLEAFLNSNSPIANAMKPALSAYIS